MTTTFERGLSDQFLKMLKEEADKKGWWADVLRDPALLIALRGTYLNVYWHGQSISLVREGSSGLIATTHEKYLLDPALGSQVQLKKDGKFDIADLLQKGFTPCYEGKATLEKLKRASGLYSGPEKTGCHQIAIGKSCVIDCEIAFPGIALPDDGSGDGHTDDAERGRVDLACLERDGEDVRLVFWEAKYYRNNDLRADLRSEERLPHVCQQVQKYRDYLSTNGEAVASCYVKVAKNLVAICNMVEPKRRLPQLIGDIGLGTRRLVLGTEPRVGLIIFGYDEATKNSKRWQRHLQRLNGSISYVVARGDAKEIRLQT
jgi:hypothetical protein